MKRLVKFRLKSYNDIQIGYLVKDKNYTGGFKVISTNKKFAYAISLLDILEKI
jgi:hypothetical protein